MTCPYCKNPATFGDNAGFYGRRYTSSAGSYMAWYCTPCSAYVGTHHNDPNRPLGTMANDALRKQRIAVHAMIDPLWKSKQYTRAVVYERLTEAFGRQIHVGEADEKTCEELIKIIPSLFVVTVGSEKE